MEAEITLDQLLKTENIDGKPYLCDIDRWLGVTVPLKDKVKIQDKLCELKKLK